MPSLVRILFGGSSQAPTPHSSRAERRGLEALLNIAWGLDSYLSGPESRLLATKSDQFRFPGPL